MLCLYGIPQGSVLGALLFLLYTQPLSSMEKHSASHSEFADGTQLYNSALCDHIHSPISNMESCISASCQCQAMDERKQIAINNEKTGGPSHRQLNSQNLPPSLYFCPTPVPFVKSARHLSDLFH